MIRKGEAARAEEERREAAKLQLAIAYAQCKITTAEAQRGLQAIGGTGRSKPNTILASALMTAIRRGKVEVRIV